MKYRRLTKEELKELEPEFIRFLASQGLDADSWVKLKEESKEKAEGMIDIFSDIVMEKILQNVEFLEQRNTKDYRVFKFFDTHAEMIGIFVEGNTDTDFTKAADPTNTIRDIQASGGRIRLFTGKKEYQKTKEMEISVVMDQPGVSILENGAMFDTFKALLPKK